MGEADGDLSFKKDDILYVDESLPKGSFGTWMAWQLDENAQQIQRGQIPSKYMWVDGAPEHNAISSAAARRSGGDLGRAAERIKADRKFRIHVVHVTRCVKLNVTTSSIPVRPSVLSCGRMDQEFYRRHSVTEMKEDSGKTLSAAARRSFFRRKQKHKRSSSKDSKEMVALDAISTDSIPFLDGEH